MIPDIGILQNKARKEKIMTITEIKKSLEKVLSSKRYEHTLGVEYTASCLAMRHGADLEKARIAGLLHDCAKYLSSDQKIESARKYGMFVSEYEKKNPELLHAKLGACFAHDVYGIEDPEILSAITWHTTGKPDMALLDKIIYIADYIEPNRNQAPNLRTVRKLAFSDLDQCLYQILEDSVIYLAHKKSVTDPMTEQTYQYYKKKTGR